MSSFMERLSKADQIFRIEILEFTWQSNNKTVIVRSGDKGKSLYARFTLRFFGGRLVSKTGKTQAYSGRQNRSFISFRERSGIKYFIQPQYC